MKNATESLRIVASTTTVTVPEHFGHDMANCYHMHDLAMGELDAYRPGLSSVGDFDRLMFALHEAKRRFDELYIQFAAADHDGRAAGIHGDLG